MWNHWRGFLLGSFYAGPLWALAGLGSVASGGVRGRVGSAAVVPRQIIIRARKCHSWAGSDKRQDGWKRNRRERRYSKRQVRCGKGSAAADRTQFSCGQQR
jgi:hypothetical protein